MLTFINIHTLNITLKKVAIIENEKITLADLTETFEGDRNDYLKIHQVIIAELPYESRILNIQSRQVLQKIKLFNPDVDIKVNSIVTAVRWNKLNLSSSYIQEKTKSYLQNYYSLSDKAEIKIINNPTVEVPSNNIDLRFKIQSSLKNQNYVRMDTEVFYENKRVNYFNLIVSIEDYIDVFQATKNIKRNENIKNDDLLTVAILTNINHDYHNQLEFNQDYVAKRIIRKGSILKKSDIITAPSVSRNDLVTVLIKTVSMQMSYQALAKNNGWIGDKIMLQNPDSKKLFYAEVVEKNKVLIDLED
jgi:flagella basal body P-ring formation protein FlgA